jgi:hypothetical protein
MDQETEAIRAAWRLGLRIAERTGYDLEPKLTVHSGHAGDPWYIAMQNSEGGPLLEVYSYAEFEQYAEAQGWTLAEAPL